RARPRLVPLQPGRQPPDLAYPERLPDPSRRRRLQGAAHRLLSSRLRRLAPHLPPVPAARAVILSPARLLVLATLAGSWAPTAVGAQAVTTTHGDAGAGAVVVGAV